MLDSHDYYEDLILRHMTGDGLSPREETRLQTHLDGCEQCRAFHNEWLDIAGATRLRGERYASSLPPLTAHAFANSNHRAALDDKSAMTIDLQERQVRRRVPATRRWLTAAAVLVAILGAAVLLMVNDEDDPPSLSVTRIAQEPTATLQAVEPSDQERIWVVAPITDIQWGEILHADNLENLYVPISDAPDDVFTTPLTSHYLIDLLNASISTQAIPAGQPIGESMVQLANKSFDPIANPENLLAIDILTAYDVLAYDPRLADFRELVDAHEPSRTLLQSGEPVVVFAPSNDALQGRTIVEDDLDALLGHFVFTPDQTRYADVGIQSVVLGSYLLTDGGVVNVMDCGITSLQSICGRVQQTLDAPEATDLAMLDVDVPAGRVSVMLRDDAGLFTPGQIVDIYSGDELLTEAAIVVTNFGGGDDENSRTFVNVAVEPRDALALVEAVEAGATLRVEERRKVQMPVSLNVPAVTTDGAQLVTIPQSQLDLNGQTLQRGQVVDFMVREDFINTPPTMDPDDESYWLIAQNVLYLTELATDDRLYLFEVDDDMANEVQLAIDSGETIRLSRFLRAETIIDENRSLQFGSSMTNTTSMHLVASLDEISAPRMIWKDREISGFGTGPLNVYGGCDPADCTDVASLPLLAADAFIAPRAPNNDMALWVQSSEDADAVNAVLENDETLVFSLPVFEDVPLADGNLALKLETCQTAWVTEAVTSDTRRVNVYTRDGLLAAGVDLLRFGGGIRVPRNSTVMCLPDSTIILGLTPDAYNTIANAIIDGSVLRVEASEILGNYTVPGDMVALAFAVGTEHITMHGFEVDDVVTIGYNARSLDAPILDITETADGNDQLVVISVSPREATELTAFIDDGGRPVITPLGMTEVYVATVDIPENTEITADMITVSVEAEDDLPFNPIRTYQRAREDVIGRTTHTAISTGAALTYSNTFDLRMAFPLGQADDGVLNQTEQGIYTLDNGAALMLVTLQLPNTVSYSPEDFQFGADVNVLVSTVEDGEITNHDPILATYIGRDTFLSGSGLDLEFIIALPATDADQLNALLQQNTARVELQSASRQAGTVAGSLVSIPWDGLATTAGFYVDDQVVIMTNENDNATIIAERATVRRVDQDSIIVSVTENEAVALRDAIARGDAIVMGLNPTED